MLSPTPPTPPPPPLTLAPSTTPAPASAPAQLLGPTVVLTLAQAPARAQVQVQVQLQQELKFKFKFKLKVQFKFKFKFKLKVQFKFGFSSFWTKSFIHITSARCFPDKWQKLGDYVSPGADKSEEDRAISELLEPLRKQRAMDYFFGLFHPPAQKPPLNNNWASLREKVWSKY